MTTLQACLNYLRAISVRHAHTTHDLTHSAEEVASAEHMPPDRMSKTVVLQDNEGFVLVVVAADSSVDVETLRTAIGVPTLCVAEETDLASLFPHADVGAMPPLGNLFNLPVYLDREVSSREFIAFYAGTHRDVIHMRVADFWDLVRPVVGDFCQSRPSGVVRRARYA